MSKLPFLAAAIALGLPMPALAKAEAKPAAAPAKAAPAASPRPRHSATLTKNRPILAFPRRPAPSSGRSR